VPSGAVSREDLRRTRWTRGVARRATEAKGFGDHSTLRVTALGGNKGSFLLEMGGQRLLINPNLDGCAEMPPEKVHEMVDYVILTSAQDEFMHAPTLARMNLAKTNFVACEGAGEVLSTMLVRNMAVLAPGPEGRALLTGEKGSAAIAVLVAPGARSGLPWQTPEIGFIFVNLETGIALAYEAFGQFLGSGAASDREGIPEEAYQVDYVVTPNLREAGGVAEGLTKKGAVLRGIVRLPAVGVQDDSPNPLLTPLLALDKGFDSALGGAGEGSEEFRAFLQKQGPPLSETRLIEPTVGGGHARLE